MRSKDRLAELLQVGAPRPRPPTRPVNRDIMIVRC